jgi:hypothetical protein
MGKILSVRHYPRSGGYCLLKENKCLACELSNITVTIKVIALKNLFFAGNTFAGFFPGKFL